MYIQKTLPWDDSKPVRSTGELSRFFKTHLKQAAQFLPTSIELLFDKEIHEHQVKNFLEEMISFLLKELRAREARKRKFVDLGLFSDSEMNSFLTNRRHFQPWLLFYSKKGGLDISRTGIGDEISETGVYPCYTLPNHAVAWKRDSEQLCCWLITARKEWSKWDWDSDIGHESGHAAFAQFPLFPRAVNIGVKNSDLSQVKHLKDLTPSHLARMIYLTIEMSVIAMRGEERETGSKLPVAETVEEMTAFLRLSHALMPTAGFDKALAAYERVGGSVDINQGTEMYEIAAPIIRIVPALTKKIVGKFITPSVELFQTIISWTGTKPPRKLL